MSGHDIQITAYGDGAGYPGGNGAKASGGAINPFLPAPSASDAAANVAVPPVSTPAQKVHRLLRGRYGLAIGLAAAGAVVGALAGYFSAAPGYKAIGLIGINSTVTVGTPIDPSVPAYQALVQYQIAYLTNSRVLQDAAASETWRQTHPNESPEDSLADLQKNLEVGLAKMSQSLIEIDYTDVSPTIAKSAVKAVMDSYMNLYGNRGSDELEKKIAYYQAQQAEIEARRQTAQATIAALSTKYGFDDMTQVISGKTTTLVQLDTEINQAQTTLAAAASAKPSDKPAAPTQVDEGIVSSISQMDPTMHDLVHDRNVDENALAQLQRRYGSAMPAVQDAQANLQIAQQRVQDYATQFLRRNPGRIGPDGVPLPAVSTVGPLPNTPAEIEALRTTLNNLHNERDTLHQQIADMTKQQQDITAQRLQMAQDNDSYASNARLLDQLRAQQALSVQIQRVGEPNVPSTPGMDKRKQFAALGFIGGAGLPVGLLLLVGLLDSRYRYSEEAGEDLSGIPLLGILPNLPDRLTDPEQASIAAHCVHQIRTMMQINQGIERQCFAVTSAAPGDGKTSLTLALGLSYAACGTRVLLIDCDLIGAGLTARMNINTAEGVLEAVANRSLLEYVRTTDIPDVAMLPVGAAGTHHASTLSPQALRRLIADAKRHYDVILIDTGPILGSIEASLVCAACDGVVLAVARGQQRPLVEKSLMHLQGIGARLTGVVFNKAQTTDFNRNFSGNSVRGGRNGLNAGQGQFSPAARGG